MKELVVISGKGGTGKTSIVASFAALADRAVLADCDVDAADLHLVLEPNVLRSEEFSAGSTAKLDHTRCTSCGKCVEVCRFDAVTVVRPEEGMDLACRDCDFCKRSCALRANAEIAAMTEVSVGTTTSCYRIDPIRCEGCGVCVRFCPADAITLEPAISGEWYVSDTRHGPMVHAKLGVAEDNSGKLVTLVRTEARKLAEAKGLDWLITDGSPGIGCPVIASVTGADLVLVVAEPTASGLHDLQRVVELAKHFGVPVQVCTNKWDLNPDVTDQIEAFAGEQGLPVAGRVRYDKAFTAAMIAAKSVVEYQAEGCAADIAAVWSAVRDSLATTGG